MSLSAYVHIKFFTKMSWVLVLISPFQEEIRGTEKAKNIEKMLKK